MGDIPPVRDTIMATDWRWWWSLWGKESLSSHQSCPHNWKNSLMGMSLSWSLKVHVMKGEKCMPREKQCSIYYGNGWSSSCFWTKDGWQTFCFPLSSEKKEFVNLLQVYSVTLLMSYIPLVIGKVSYTGWHRTWPPRNFHKERLEIVAKAVTRVKDGSFEMIFVSAGKGKQKGFVEKFHECGVPKHQMIIWSPSNNGEELKRWLCEADLAIVPSG